MKHQFTIQEWFDIRVCTKCGKANDVMRKYCAGCGASLIKKEEDPIPEPVEEIEEAPIAGAPGFSEEDIHVLPSEVASEQVEIEGAEPETNAEIEESPLSGKVSIEPEGVEEEVDGPVTEPMGDEEGRAVVKDILERVKAAEDRTRGEEGTEPSDTDLEPPPAETLEIEEPLVYEEPVGEIEVEEPIIVEEPEAPETGFIAFEEPSEVASTTPQAETTDVPVKDEKIRVLETDIKAFNIEREQLKSEFDTLRTRLDEEVERYNTVAQVKRTRTESIERELSLAKKEQSDANKEFKNADNHRKKEISNAEKRIREVEKRIKKAEDSREKRLRDLEKERLKREEEARKI